ncbi:hypothetical protein A0H81_12546 [Grifola frondosa]|uniref:Uncharacterized protein n=1 Tax=Grifola frondosa TaxID=5627 RepID=A0A1C7LRU3_GRIFR|nr:hypothetical protein A0H81_12546 [Grifola frondosa]
MAWEQLNEGEAALIMGSENLICLRVWKEVLLGEQLYSCPIVDDNTIRGALMILRVCTTHAIFLRKKVCRIEWY